MPVKRASSPSETAPIVVPAVVPNAPVHVADGYHREFRYWVTKQADVLHPIVHIQGWDGPHHVSFSREMEGASKAKVARWIDQVIAQIAADAGKRRAKGAR